MSGLEITLLLGWGTLVGLDLVTGPQMMIARPLVAGSVGGLVLGDPGGGFAVGALLECCALEVMPFGSARYADYGLGAVAAAAVAAGTPSVLGVGIGAALGLGVAMLGETTTQVVRRINSADGRRHADQLDAGDIDVIESVHRRCVFRDAQRAFLVTALGLAGAILLRRFGMLPLSAVVGGTAAALGVAIGTAVVGGGRYARASRLGTAMFVAGLLAGTTWVTLA